MADIQVLIKFGDSEDGVLESLSSQTRVNNASIQQPDVEYDTREFIRMSKKNDGRNLKSWATGSLSLKDGYVGDKDTKLVNQYGYEGYMFGATDSEGKLNVHLYVSGKDIPGIVVYGDKQANQFPTKAYFELSGEILYNSDNVWTIVFDTPRDYVSIVFTEWNRADYNACLTSVQKLSHELLLDKSQIKSLESLSQSTGQPNEIFYGVVPNSGSMEIVDRDRELLDMIKEGFLPTSKVPTEVKVNGNNIQNHIVVDSSYSKSDGIFSLEKTNSLENLDNINFAGFELSETQTTAYELFVRMMTTIGYLEEQISTMIQTKIVVEQLSDEMVSVEDYLKAVIIKQPYMDSSTAREAIEKFCNLLQLQFITDNNGNPIFVSARPVASPEMLSKTIVIPAKSQLSTFEKVEIVKNEYDAVELNVKKVQPRIDYGVVVGDFASSDFSNMSNPINSVNSDTAWTYDSRAGGQYFDVAYAEEQLFYKNITLEIPKKQNKNTEEIIKLLYGLDKKDEPNIRYTVKFIEMVGDAQGECNFYNGTLSKNVTVSKVSYFNEKEDSDNQQNGSFSNDVSIYVEVYKRQNTPGVTARLSEEIGNITNKTNLEEIKIGSVADGIVDNGDSYSVNAVVLVAKRVISMDLSGVATELASNIFPITGKSVYWKPLQLEISFYGDKRVIDISDISVSDENISVAKNPVRLEHSELLQSDTQLTNGTNLAEQMKANIHSDYAGGVSTAKTTVACMDYYDINGNLLKEWANGEIFNIGDIARVDKDNSGTPISQYKNGGSYYWKIIGRNFRCAGVPLIDLELQEIKLPRPLILTIPQGLIVESRGDRIYNGHEVPFGESVVVRGIDFTLPSNLSTLNWIKANGTEIEVGQEIPVNSDITFSYSYTPVQIFSLDENDRYTTFETGVGGNAIVYNPYNYGIISIESPPVENELTLNVLSADHDESDPSYNADTVEITLNPNEPVVGTYEDGLESFEYSITHREITIKNNTSGMIGRKCYLEGAYIMPEVIK